MTTVGLDYAWSKPSVSAIKAGGYEFVLRYLSWLPNGKVIDAAELRALRAAGIAVGLNWEHTATDALRGADGGRTDATEAVRQAQALGYPAGRTIYFSVDFDQTAAQAPACNAYLRAARDVLHHAGYRMGVYGGYHAVRRALDAGVVDDAWQTYAWSGGRWDDRAHLRQVKNGITVGGADCDRDEIHGSVHLMGDIMADETQLDRIERRQTQFFQQLMGVAPRSDGATYGVQQIQADLAALAAKINALDAKLSSLQAGDVPVTIGATGSLHIGPAV